MKIRVVVADDFPLVREGVVRALKHDPALEVVGQACNGQEALELASSLKPDVMILDLRMPDLGGLAVLEKLRTEQAAVRVIVMTASEQAGTLLDAIAAGAAGYLSKRTTGEELRQAVITAHGGGSVITPSLASHLLKEFSSSARGEQSTVARCWASASSTSCGWSCRAKDRQRDRRGAVHLPAHGAEPPHAHPREDGAATARRAHPLGRRARDRLSYARGGSAVSMPTGR